jgi:hypothetical protein
VTRYQYRVTWHREGWKTWPKSRTYSRQSDAERLIDKLLDPGVRDLTPLDLLRVDRRPVGGWEAEPAMLAAARARRRRHRGRAA